MGGGSGYFRRRRGTLVKDPRESTSPAIEEPVTSVKSSTSQDFCGEINCGLGDTLEAELVSDDRLNDTFLLKLIQCRVEEITQFLVLWPETESSTAIDRISVLVYCSER